MIALLFHLSVTAAAFAMAGPLWAAIAFLSVALVRVAIVAEARRRENEELRRRLPEESLPVDPAAVARLAEVARDERAAARQDAEGPPQSGARERGRVTPTEATGSG